ncbi:heterokaryon incompatibility protein-domain-containing protein [Hypoxylon sp. FL0890]|nr:heterokaryon incompatibility protein-domain-containing protein [Hypoxylon sp. FL0890]
MWLINTKTLKLEYIANARRVSYAILSHTWEDDEVSFQTFADLASARSMHGFTKIEKTCKLARDKYHLEYAWVDTCCIDKTSSAELSEAINSMYRWYQAAAVCFVHLSDMTPDTVETKRSGAWFWRDLRGVPRLLKECKWFTRGWTLQELLAPRDVEFYDASWDFMGTKDSLLEQLSEITGIEPIFLKHGSLIWSASIGTRMRWAAERETTRPEDIAYCLLGIFEINMPLLYGEGNKAFLRLQEEICKQTNDLSLFAWTTQPGHASSLFDKYRGIFATHPCEFADFRGLAHQSGGGTFQGELAVTNKGLRLDDIQLYRSLDGGLMLPLGCFGQNPDDNSQGASYGILLTLTLDGYIRREPGILAVLPGNLISGIPPHRIYIKKQLPLQWPNSKRLQDQHVDGLFFEFKGQPSTVVIMNAIPQESFDYNHFAFLTGGKDFFGYLRLRVSNVELMIMCWLKRPVSKGDSPRAPLEAKYSFVVEGEDGWDRIRLFENEIKNRAVHDGIIPSLFVTRQLTRSHDKMVTSLGSSGKQMVMESTKESKRYQLVVTFPKTTKKRDG